MEFYRDIPKTTDVRKEVPVIFVLTGDGGREYHTINGFCKIFDNRQGCLLFPKTPPGMTSRSGFTALNAIKTLTSKYHYKQYLLVFDREYCQSENPCDEIIIKIKSLGFTISSFNCVIYENNLGGFLTLSWGSHTVDLMLSIFGKNRRIEDNYVDLVQRQWGETIGYKKKDLSRFQNGRKLKPHELITKSNRGNVRDAFPCLYSIFQSFPQKSRDN